MDVDSPGSKYPGVLPRCCCAGDIS